MQRLSILAVVVLVLSGCGARLAEVQTCRIVSCNPSVDVPVNDGSEKHELIFSVENNQGVDFLIVKDIRRDWIEFEPFSGGGIHLRDIKEGNTVLKVRTPPTVTRCMTDSGRLSFCFVFNTAEEFREHVIEATSLGEKPAPREPYSYTGWIVVWAHHPYTEEKKSYLAKGSITEVDFDMVVRIEEGVPDSVEKTYMFSGWGYRKDINVPVLHSRMSGDGRPSSLELLSRDTM